MTKFKKLMKKLIEIFLGIIAFALFTTACDSILDADSNRLVFPDEHQLNSPDDTIYSMVGIFSQLEKLAERYAILGELRGDLMDVTDNADPDLLEVYNFDISSDNKYNIIEDYYSVINNCNYVIKTLDTSIISKGEKVMYKQLAATKAIRAWTYLQLVLNYGKVKYFEHPILTIKDAEIYDVYSLQELVPVLIDDLKSWTGISMPGEISLGENISTDKSFFPVSFVLGDLYLWNGEYEKAAIEYYNLIKKELYVIDDYFTNKWTVTDGVFVEREMEFQNWFVIFALTTSEQISLIASPNNEYEINPSNLEYITWKNVKLVPSQIAIDNWNTQIYYHTAKIIREGDLRGDIGSYISPESGLISSNINLILKYYLSSSSSANAVCIYRVGLLYLRYAEAVNRAGKPNLAVAVIKNGLSSKTMEVDSIVPKHEKYIKYTDSTSTFYSYVNFEDINFDDNIGVRERGCGDVHLSNDYRIAKQNSLQDSILYVEDLIVEELALETAFEGNRFHDLMRIAIRRNDPSYLANKVSEKYTDNKDEILNKLLDENNWYLP